MFAARKNARYDIKMEWTRPAEHGGAEVFDIYAVNLNPGWHIVRCDFIDEEGEPVAFNMSSFSDEEELAIQNALQDEWEGLGLVRH